VSFASDVERIAGKMETSVEKVAAGVFIKLFQSVIQATPVDTGRLRGEWQTTKKSKATALANRKQIKNFGPSSQQAKKVINDPDVYYLTNLMPYAHTVEYGKYGKGPGVTEKTAGTGFSIQAPRGMIRINVKRIKRLVKREAAK